MASAALTALHLSPLRALQRPLLVQRRSGVGTRGSVRQRARSRLSEDAHRTEKEVVVSCCA